MPSGSFVQVNVKCPFFKYDDGKKRITCEGIIDSSNTASLFFSKKDYETQINTYCCDRYKYCEIYRTIMKKYDKS